MGTKSLTHEEQVVIRKFARGIQSFRLKAIRIYHDHLGVWNSGEETPIELKFMSEICNAVPDLAYRAVLRKQLQVSFKGIDY